MTESTDRVGPEPTTKEPEPALGGLGRGAHIAVRFVALAAIGASLFVFHGISSNLTPWSQAIVNGIVKYAYGTAGQQSTTVVLFREENLKTLDEAYPVSFERHAQVLEALAVYRPRAVFVDFAFMDRRRPAEVARLSEAICELRDAGTSVYLAVPAPAAEGEPPSPVLPELLRCAAPASARRDPEQGGSGILTYDHGVRTPRGFLASAAFAMAASPLGLTPEREQPMEIIWGNGVAPLNRKWMRCESHGTLAYLIRVFRQNPMAAKLRCPYTRTISVVQLLTSTGDPDVQDALEGQAVFYGAAFQLTGDRVASPVYEELPGVYLHAMAYDNLVTFGRDYKRARRELAPVAGAKLAVPLSWVVDGLLLLATAGMLLVVDEPALTRRFGQRLPAARDPGADSPTRGFVRRHLGAVAAAAGAIALFVAVDRSLGPEAALLLVVLPGYGFYKTVIARDAPFVATACLVVLASLASFLPPINLGPRNVLAYVAFFEVARHLVGRADRAATAYARLRQEHPAPRDWGLNPATVRVLDRLFLLCARPSNTEVVHATVTPPAG